MDDPAKRVSSIAWVEAPLSGWASFDALGPKVGIWGKARFEVKTRMSGIVDDEEDEEKGRVKGVTHVEARRRFGMSKGASTTLIPETSFTLQTLFPCFHATVA